MRLNLTAPGTAAEGSGFTTERAVALIVLGALVVLLLVRTGFSGALGD